jgi:hypothetical protein
VAGVPDCVLYESQAIVEWLEEIVPFLPAAAFKAPAPSGGGRGGGAGGDAAGQPLALYPSSPLGRVDVKLWQYVSTKATKLRKGKEEHASAELLRRARTNMPAATSLLIAFKHPPLALCSSASRYWELSLAEEFWPLSRLQVKASAWPVVALGRRAWQACINQRATLRP